LLFLFAGLARLCGMGLYFREKSTLPPTSFLPLALLLGCTAGPGTGESQRQGEGSGGAAQGSGGAGLEIDNDDDDWIIVDGTGGGESTADTVTIIETLPEGFSAADEEHPETSRGGFRVLGPLSEISPPEGECANILRVIVRDFQGTHDDFENAGDWSKYEVATPLAETRKPQKTSENGPLRFAEWYQNLEDVNLPFAVDLWLEPVGGTFVYDSRAFFPLDGVGFMDNYLFTTELHTQFEYQGGEVFTFRGDDDVFVFINGHLAVNLSGVHDAQEGSVHLDDQASALGIQIGGVYTFDLFQAERQPSGSNFRLETTLAFTGCGEILPVDIIR
jgi:fibro-slime domain-containing protein